MKEGKFGQLNIFIIHRVRLMVELGKIPETGTFRIKIKNESQKTEKE